MLNVSRCFMAALLLCSPLMAQTWFKVAKEGSAITSAAPITVKVLCSYNGATYSWVTH